MNKTIEDFLVDIDRTTDWQESPFVLDEEDDLDTTTLEPDDMIDWDVDIE
jgi:hypothetical protein